MSTPQDSTRRALSPVATLVAAAVRSVRYKPRPGVERSWTEKKVVKGEQHPCVILDNIVCDLADRGASVSEVRGIARAFDLGIRRVFGAVPNLRDLKALLRREQDCQCRADVIQLDAMTPENMTDVELETLRDRLSEHAEAATEAAAGIDAFLLDRQITRDAARRRIA